MERFVWIIDEKCNRCAECISACPKEVFELRPKGYVYVTGWPRCDCCGVCIEVCDQEAIEMGEMLPSFTEKKHLLLRETWSYKHQKGLRACGFKSARGN